jgi:hypothetical protein
VTKNGGKVGLEEGEVKEEGEVREGAGKRALEGQGEGRSVRSSARRK